MKTNIKFLAASVLAAICMASCEQQTPDVNYTYKEFGVKLSEIEQYAHNLYTGSELVKVEANLVKETDGTAKAMVMPCDIKATYRWLKNGQYKSVQVFFNDRWQILDKIVDTQEVGYSAIKEYSMDMEKMLASAYASNIVKPENMGHVVLCKPATTAEHPIYIFGDDNKENRICVDCMNCEVKLYKAQLFEGKNFSVQFAEMMEEMLKVSPTLKLYEVQTKLLRDAEGKLTSNVTPDNFMGVYMLPRGEEEYSFTTIVNYNEDWKMRYEVIEDVWLEDVIIENWKDIISLDDAIKSMYESGLTIPTSDFMTFRSPLGRKLINPQYLFGSSRTGLVYVDAITGNVSLDPFED